MLAAVTWIGALMQYVTSHFSVLLSGACGVAALVASVYSIKASRAKAKFYIDKDSKIENDNG